MELLLVIIVILLLIGVVPRWGYNANWGYGPFGVLLAIVLIIVILRLLHLV